RVLFLLFVRVALVISCTVFPLACVGPVVPGVPAAHVALVVLFSTQTTAYDVVRSLVVSEMCI
ncbi:hypothetical protein, partial [Clostridioides difficile]|uniref:hypothetical protein n=1 Tax=Clostridioides difficile TaxID=1496 RepID=UPI000BCCF4F3